MEDWLVGGDLWVFEHQPEHVYPGEIRWPGATSPKGSDKSSKVRAKARYKQVDEAAGYSVQEPVVYEQTPPFSNLISNSRPRTFKSKSPRL